MRKYLWALALCGAAGISVPSWAQERTKSLFGLGRSSKTEAKTAEKTTEKTAKADKSAKTDKSTKTDKPIKLKNYGELFGRNSQSKKGAADDAPSADAVQKTITESDKSRSAAKEEQALDREDMAIGRASTSSKSSFDAKPKARVASKSSSLDDLDDMDVLEEQEEREEEEAEAVVKRVAPRKPVAPARPAPPAEGRVVVRPPVTKKPPVRTAAIDKPVEKKAISDSELPDWASSAPEEEPVVSDFDPAAEPEESLSIKQVRADAATVVRRVSSPPSETPAPEPEVRDSATRDEPVARAQKSKLFTPINVDSKSDESVADAFAAETPAEPVTTSEVVAPPKSSSRLTITRNNSRAAATPVVAEPDARVQTSDLSPAKTSTAVSQTPNVTVEFRSTGSVTVGQESSCELVVKNSGAVAAQKVEVEASFPSNVKLVSTDPKPESNAKLVWEFAEIESGEEKIVQVKFIPVERGEVAAAASVRFTGAASTSFAVTEPLLALKLEGPVEVMVGESASQTLIISNPGTGTAANVKVEAILPAGLEHAKGDRLLMDLGNLAPGENRPIRLALTAVAGGRQVIEVHSTADNGLVKSAAAEVSVIAPSLKASIEGPGLRYLGRHATYTLHVANDGSAATDNVRVMHKIPDGLELISAEKGALYDSQTRMLNWFVGRLDRGETSDVSVVLNAKSPGEFTHFIRATSEHGATCDSEISTRIEGAASLVVDVSDLDDPVEVGVETAYEIKVKNEGTAPATNVGLTCELPTGMEFLAASGDSKSIHHDDQIAFEPVSQIAPGKTLTYRVKVKGTLSGNMRFRTKLSSDSLADPLTSEEMTKIYGE